MGSGVQPEAMAVWVVVEVPMGEGASMVGMEEEALPEAEMAEAVLEATGAALVAVGWEAVDSEGVTLVVAAVEATGLVDSEVVGVGVASWVEEVEPPVVAAAVATVVGPRAQS